eukprot:Blabericola_migrator_1__3125@NODE_1910_length_3575_cov_109_348347_g1199_i1_p1_GENE_NODE_1910_length_3575_cov_109_348347_g1199_i1NODE_1910_length_3575_cov_109_348347_g1199_i1_p1_ORF_typecomplete_len829_score176_61PCI/PF01399_27/0_0045PCI/PF01399_27/7_2e03PCI/PF01399_27/1_2e04RNA_pol_L/PF01193_24/0_21RNA_pol_L/PF01193_24/3e03TERT_thumb/PF17984_1/0_31MscS_TM/PF12794_7/13_NODE_1910_length_3575_cov_109_348347_g1199_i19973483
MSQFLAPPSALLRATELTSVGQDSEAFETLHRTITDRRFRYIQWEASQQEEVVAQYVYLTIKLDRIKSAREGLMQYRNHCQHTMSQPGALERVLRKFRTYAEDALKEAMALKEAKEAEDASSAAAAAAIGSKVFDAEGGEGVDAVELLHQAVVGEDCWSAETRRYQAMVKLTLEVYRTIMDIIKTTPKLQKLYHETAHRAFEFCCDHQRPNDFRRLCEMVRNHYTSITKPQKPRADADPQAKHDYDELKLPELHIETRLSQLKNAAALELWKEAMQTMEDLYSLGIIELASKRLIMKSKTPGSLQLRQLLLMSLAAYYEKLAEVFGRSGFANLHAFALLKWLAHTKAHNKALTPEEHSVWASVAALAVLSVPINRSSEIRSGARYDEEKKLTTLLGHPTVPTRASLINMLRDRGILQMAFPCVQQFFSTIEGPEFLPFTVVGKVLPLFDEIRSKLAEADRHVTEKTATVIFTAGTFSARGEEYIAQLKEVVFRKLVMKLGGVYSIMNIDFFRTKVCPADFMPWSKAERSLVALVDECKISLRLDYMNGVIRLSDSDESVDRSAGTVAKRLSTLSTQLLKVLSALDTKSQDALVANKERELLARIPLEAEQAGKRLNLLKQRRLELDEMKKKREMNLEEIQKEKEKRELQVEREKQRILQEEKAQLKKKAETEQARLECASQLLSKMKQLCTAVGASPNHFVISRVTLGTLTPEALIAHRLTFRDYEQALYDHQSKAKQELLKQKRQEQKKLDHFCRAIRIEEAKAVDAWKQRVKESDPRLIAEFNEKRQAERESRIENTRIRHRLLVEAEPLLQKYLEEMERQAERRD